MSSAYSQLLVKVREIYSLRSALALLGWDQETTMPARGAEARANSIAVLSGVIQEKYIDKELEGLCEASQVESLTDSEKAMLCELYRDIDQYKKIPIALTTEIAHTTSLAQNAWASARQKNTPQDFLPLLEKVFGLMRKKAEALGYEEHPYDALLDIYEPGARCREIGPILEDLEHFSSDLLTQIIDKNKSQKVMDIDARVFSVSLQQTFSKQVLLDMGFNLDAGRLDVSAHPFTEGLHPTDVRLTTRYRENELLSGLFGTIHEGGHGLYEQGFLPEYYGTPLAEAVSLGIHESQSRLWENQVGRSQVFWNVYYPKLQTLFADVLSDVSIDQFLLYVNRVKPSLIRVEADEVSYILHIVLRYKLEKSLLQGEMQVKDLEAAWNEEMQKLLGLRPSTAAEGFLQDIHWSLGLVGYFPTYALGSVYAAQLYAAAQKQTPEMISDFRMGSFSSLREWLRLHVHRHGRMYRPFDLIQMATGKAPDTADFKVYMQEKYLGK